jgi:anti-sigma B factor antagonist
MNYTEEIRNDVVIVKVLHTEATLKHAMDFRNYLMGVLISGKKKIIVDLSETTFMDSTFLGVMVFTLKKTMSYGGDLRIVRNNMDAPIWLMFEITNMIKVFKIFEKPADALASFTG